MSAAEEWIDLIIRRSDELRRKGILSIGSDGQSAVLAPLAAGELDDRADNSNQTSTESDEPANAWENPASYPTGYVPKLDHDDADGLPEIPQFGDG